MAQTKSKSSSTRSGRKQARKTNGTTSSSRKAAAAKRRRSGSVKPRKSKQATNGTGKVDAAREAVEETTKDARGAVGEAASKAGEAASKAKVPLLAGGAALAGVAGGMALGARQSGRNGVAGRASRRPQLKLKSGDLARAAKEVGRFGGQMGRLATELQHAREADENGRSRSPVEVVLQGLTSRRASR